jgi:hypothetical protein
VGKSSSKERHQNVKKSKFGGIISMESSNRNISSKELSSDDTEYSILRKKKRRWDKTRTFDGEIKKGEEVETWLLGMRKYFQVHNYSKNTKVKITIFDLNEGAFVWCEDLKEVKVFKENKLTWKQFEKYFKKAYLLEKYYDGKIKKFHEHKLGQILFQEVLGVVEVCPLPQK